MKASGQTLLSLDVARPEPLFQQIADRLGEFIRTTGLQPGEPVPPVRELARKFEVNELTVRRGMKILVQQGLLCGRQGKGVFVTQKGGRPHVLLICGQPLFVPASETYFPILYQTVQEELAEHGIDVEPLWAPPQDPESVRDYCLQGSLYGYVGFFFVGCGQESDLVRHVQQYQRPYVMLAGSRLPWCVCTDYRHAYRLGLKELAENGARQVTVITLTEARNTLSVRQRDIAEAAPPSAELATEVFGIEHDQALETEGYRLVHELAATGRLANHLFVTNDLIAKGASRAVLALRGAGRPAPSRLVVVASPQQVVPLGLPVTYIGQSVCEAARQAVTILRGAMAHDPDAPTMTETTFHLWHDSGDGLGASHLNAT